MAHIYESCNLLLSEALTTSWTRMLQPRLMAVLLIVGALVVLTAAQDEDYPNIYDNVDVDSILNNKRLYKRYFDCLRSGRSCTPDGKALRGILNTICTSLFPKG